MVWYSFGKEMYFFKIGFSFIRGIVLSIYCFLWILVKNRFKKILKLLDLYKDD